MKNSILVTANPTTGQIFVPNKKLGKDGKTYGYVRLEQKTVDLDSNIGSLKKASILKQVTAELGNFMEVGQTFPGNILFKDSLTKSYDAQKPLQVPKRDTKGVVIKDEFSTITSDGQPVYRTYFYSSDITKTNDKLVYDRTIEVAQAAVAPKAGAQTATKIG